MFSGDIDYPEVHCRHRYLEGWMVFTPLSVNVFVTLTAQ
jgi:hypothetical protein